MATLGTQTPDQSINCEDNKKCFDLHSFDICRTFQERIPNIKQSITVFGNCLAVHGDEVLQLFTWLYFKLTAGTRNARGTVRQCGQ